MNANMESLWAAYYGDVFEPGHFNGGVVVFEHGRIFGGDSSFYYTGEYDASVETVTARIKITHFSGENVTAFGMQVSGSLDIELEGRRDGDKIIGKMWPADQPSNVLPIGLMHLEDLPNP